MCLFSFFRGATTPIRPGLPHYRGFKIIHRHATHGKIALDKWSARSRDLCLTTYNTHNRKTSMPLAEFELAIPASERQQTDALDDAATGIDRHMLTELTSTKYVALCISITWWLFIFSEVGLCDIWLKEKGKQRFYTKSVHKETELFFDLLLYLQLNQTCLLQSTPFHSWYTAPNFFSSSGTRRGMCFAGWREGPLLNFFLSPLPSEIGDLFSEDFNFGNKPSICVHISHI